MADVIFANRIGGLDGVRRDVAVVLEAVVHNILGAVVAGTLVVAVFSKIMVETDAIGQAVLVYEVHKLIHGLCPYEFYVSANR
jgi:glycerol uptake facilitator-like aquaporin